jgi:rifampicin phosphotransferase
VAPEILATDLDRIDPTDVASFGGKATALARLRRIDGVDVPDGFCLSTAAFSTGLDAVPGAREAREALSRSVAGDTDTRRSVANRLRDTVEHTAVPGPITAAIDAALARFAPETLFAVRSSATVEDLPGASFAGQHDSFLGVHGRDAVIDAVRRCWASTYSDRAVGYRRTAGVADTGVRMAVVVQQMVPATASGVLFTADPVNGDRRTATVEAVRGLGEALVAGRVGAEVYRVRGDALVAADVGGDGEPVLSAGQVVRLVGLGKRIEAELGRPQDIEWCLAGGRLFVVQSRPITTLFPIPPVDDGGYHVHLSVGHQQMMTDAMRPLGLSCWRLTTPAPVVEAGGRLFVDVTSRLASPDTRAALLRMARNHDLLTLDALHSVLDGGRVPGVPAADIAPHPEDSEGPGPGHAGEGDVPPPDPAVVIDLIARTERSLADAARRVAAASGAELFDVLREDWQELRRVLFDPDSHRVFTSAMDAAVWLNEHLLEWLGETNAADVLTKSVAHNVTSGMGLALLDVADAIRPHPEVVHFLSQVHDDDYLPRLDGVPGGREAREAIGTWLRAYGMRCPGEIDITRPRWAEHPSALLPVLLGHVEHAQPGEAARRFEQGRAEAVAWERELLQRLGEQPGGAARAEATRRRIAVVRAYIGYREHPKYALVHRYWIYKQALLREIAELVAAGVLRDTDDAFHLRFEELEDAVRHRRADLGMIDRRRAEFRSFEALTPPRVLTSDGEALNGSYRRTDLPDGALAGLAVSSGTVEGRARVLHDADTAVLEPGDVLVTRFTDPSWTPLFVTAAALVTEVGGLMTHGSVVAREYGLPAVVGVERATALIRDGQRIRVDGARGCVELLP